MSDSKINLGRMVLGFPNQQWMSIGEEARHAINAAALVRIEKTLNGEEREVLILHFSSGETLSLTPEDSQAFAGLMEHAAGKIAEIQSMENLKRMGLLGKI